jgi:hypothetical protein
MGKVWMPARLLIELTIMTRVSKPTSCKLSMGDIGGLMHNLAKIIVFKYSIFTLE